ncbi:tetratricopeptide repeat protein, partial [Verrucomicrobiales bacterium]|nr:tetratricopeptide repeat protein [Verrucomicrobiales bacterium]
DSRFIAASQAAAKEDLPSAVQLLDDLANDFPRNPDLATIRATFALRQDDTEKAVKLARGAVVTFPNHAGGNAVLGKALLEAGQASDAIPYLEKSITLDSSQPEPKRDLAGIYAKEGNTERAELLYKRVLKSEPNDADTILALTKIYELRGNDLLARDALEDAHREFPDNSMIAIALARDLQRDGDIENAIRTAEHSLISGGQDKDTLSLLATLHREAGNADEAALFEKRAEEAESTASP